MTDSSLRVPDYPVFSVQDLILQGKLLLASSGKEFIKPAGILASTAEVKKARKEAMGRLGLDFLEGVADDIDLDKEFADDDGDVQMNSVKGESSVPGSPMDVSPPTDRTSSPASDAFPDRPSGSAIPAHVAAPEQDTANMSPRELNRLKRKRKVGNSAFVAAPPSQNHGAKYSAAAAGPSKWVTILL
jgi:TATA-binding protein-associated factor